MDTLTSARLLNFYRALPRTYGNFQVHIKNKDYSQFSNKGRATFKPRLYLTK